METFGWLLRSEASCAAHCRCFFYLRDVAVEADEGHNKMNGIKQMERL